MRSFDTKVTAPVATAPVGIRGVQTMVAVGAAPRVTRPRSAPIKSTVTHKAAHDAEFEADLRKLGLGGRHVANYRISSG